MIELTKDNAMDRTLIIRTGKDVGLEEIALTFEQAFHHIADTKQEGFLIFDASEAGFPSQNMMSRLSYIFYAAPPELEAIFVVGAQSSFGTIMELMGKAYLRNSILSLKSLDDAYALIKYRN